MRTIIFLPEPLDERLLVRGLIAAAPDQGYSIDDVRLGVRVLDKIDAATDVLSLEEAEWGFLCRRIRETKWRAADAAILRLVDKISEAKEVK